MLTGRGGKGRRGAMAESGKTRLETWKEVAAFFGKDERTVKRWEAERGLPIRRLPGETRSRIYAEVAELDAWLKGASAGPLEPEPAAGVPAGRRSWRGPLLFGAAVAAAAVLGITLGMLSRPREPAPQAGPPPIAAQRLYLAGMDDWSRRTPESLHRAVDEFNQAIRLHPGYAEAYVGLANCYNLLREFTLMPPAQAYPLARTAALKALKLDERLSSAHVALAFVHANWDWDLPAARREYERAIALDPTSDLNHHWYANFLASQGDTQRAIAEFAKATELNPTSVAIRSDNGLLLYRAGRKREAIALLRQVEEENPAFLSPHRYLAAMALIEADDETFLKESEIAAKLVDDRQRMALVVAARTGRAHGGRPGMLKALLEEQLRQYQVGAVGAYSVACLYALLGDDERAFSFARTAIERREPDSVWLPGDIFFTRLRGTARYQSLTALLRPAPPSA